MSDAEILQLAERLVACEFTLTEYESFILTTVWERYAAVDPVAAHRDALLLETRVMRRTAVRIAARAWGTADPAGALANLIAAESANTEISSLGDILSVLVESDPQNAITTLDQYRGGSWYSQARGSLFHSWSNVDANAAREWLVAGMRENPENAAAMLRDLSWRDSESALDFAFGMEPNPNLVHAVSDVIAHRMMFEEGAAAVAELENVPSGWVTEALAGAVGMNGVTKMPLDQLDAVAAVFPTQALRNEFWRAALGRRASDSNFDDAVALLQRLPGGEARGRGAADVATYWAKLNPAEASEWVASLQPGPQRDGAAGGLASTIAPLDPASARTWAESISDEGLRAQTLDGLSP